MSGNALLTDIGGSLTGGEDLRFFTGSSFGPAHRVPEPSGGDDGSFTLEQAGGVVHVFFVNRRHSYDIYEVSTTDGVHWSTLRIFNTAITAGPLAPVLEKNGSGLVFETDTGGSGPLLAQPILLPVSAHIYLKPSRVKVGHLARVLGSISPHPAHHTFVELEYLKNGRWYRALPTGELASGGSLGPLGLRVGAISRSYRVVAKITGGYYLYGYSNTVDLTVVKKK